MAARCINIDWLEVYALEPTQPRDAAYFRDAGFMVEERPYGTRVYEQMFTLLTSDYFHYIEVRRKPASSVLEYNACHIRLSNRTCYFTNAVAIMRDFLDAHGYTFRRISRIDLALDFERFDSGDYPDAFARRYIQGKFAKINQSNLAAHGQDRWNERRWNSLSWGSPSSPIGTKLYCKTLELEQVKDKPYIRQAWFAAGLVDNLATMTRKAADGSVYKPSIWRLEFSIRSAVKGWVTIEADGKARNFRSIRNTLQMYDTRPKMLAMFASLCHHYFHFKIYQEGVIKYKCPDKILFRFTSEDAHYTVEKVATPITPDRELHALLLRLLAYRKQHADADLRAAADVLIQALENDDLQRCCSSMYGRKELTAIRRCIAMKEDGDPRDPWEIIRELMAETEDSAQIF